MFSESLEFLTVTNRNCWVIGSFLAYLIEILVFAKLYHRTYRADANAFFSPEQLSAARRGESLEGLGRAVASIESRTSFLTALCEALQKGTAQMLPCSEGTTTVLADGRSALFRWFDVDSPAEGYIGLNVPAFLIVYDASGSKTAEGFVEGQNTPAPTETSNAIQYIAHHLDHLRSMLRTLIDQRRQLESGSPPWTAFDFLYFSLITQTTVGYGDILPNCSKVRKLVITQVVLGLTLLALIINLTFEPGKSG